MGTGILITEAFFIEEYSPLSIEKIGNNLN
jgi:hypothetical protein